MALCNVDAAKSRTLGDRALGSAAENVTRIKTRRKVMRKQPHLSRRDFIYSSAMGTGAAAALFDPALAAAQSVGVKRGDLPDLTIKEVKVYVTDVGNVHRLNTTETGELVSVVTSSGIEGIYSLG